MQFYEGNGKRIKSNLANEPLEPAV